MISYDLFSYLLINNNLLWEKKCLLSNVIKNIFESVIKSAIGSSAIKSLIANFTSYREQRYSVMHKLIVTEPYGPRLVSAFFPSAKHSKTITSSPLIK